MALNPQFPNYANGAAGTEVIGWTVVGGQPLYRLPVAYVDTGFGAAYVCEGSTVEAPTYPEGVYDPDPNIESPGVISGSALFGGTLTFAPPSISGTAPITATYNWIRYIPGGISIVVGTGLSYTPIQGDVGHTLVVQTVASNSVATVATQTVPFGPIYATSPVISDPGTITKVGPPGDVLPGDTLSFSGSTIFCPGTYTSFTTWVNASNPDEVWQLGGDTFVVPDFAVGDSVVVRTTAFNTDGSADAVSNAIAVTGFLDVVTPSQISEFDPLYVDEGITGKPATFRSYGEPTVTYGFFDVTDPLNPLPLTPPNTTNYGVKVGDYGKSIAFITNASIGVLTARSISTVLGPVEGYLNVLTNPTVRYTGDTVYPGTVLSGTPGTFEGVPPVTSVTSGFYRNVGTASAPNWIGIGSGLTYTVQEADVGKDVAFGSSAVSPLYPSGVLALSTPVRPIHFFAFTSTGSYNNLTRPGQTPHVGDTIQQVYPNSTPQNNKNGGAVPLTGRIYLEKNGGGLNSPQSTFTIPNAYYGYNFYQIFTATYEGNTYTQTTATAVVEGTSPVIATPGTITSDNPSIPFTPGTNAIFTKPVITPGVPAAFTETWTWYLRTIGGTRTAIQTGGTTLNIPVSFSGKVLEIDYMASSVAGSATATYTSSVPVPAPALVFTFVGQLSGGTAFNSSENLTVAFTQSTATDGTGDPITITKKLWIVDSLNNKFYQALNTASGANNLIVRNSLNDNASYSLSEPPGNYRQIPYPCVGRYLSIEWVATNPKTGATATVMSNPLGPLTAPSSPYGGITPPAFSSFKPDPRFGTINCTIQLPTFNNGGYVDPATITVWRGAVSPFQPAVISTGSVTFSCVESDIFGPGGSWFTATIKGPSGNISYYQDILD